MAQLNPAHLVARAQHAYGRLRREGLDVLQDKRRQHYLSPTWSARSSASHWFTGKVGVEIGGPSRLFTTDAQIPVYDLSERVDNCNFAGETAWVKGQRAGETFEFAQGRAPGRQFFCEASDLAPIADESYDFVLSSHCIEHLADPIRGLLEWQRVLKAGGALLLVVPHKDGTFDRRRPVTPFAHLLDDFNRHTPESDLTHLEEVLRLHDLSHDPGSPNFATFKARCESNLEHRCIHHHVFNTHLTVELVDWVGLQIVHVQLLRPFHIVVLAQKLNGDVAKNNAAFLGARAKPVWQSPFPADQRNYW